MGQWAAAACGTAGLATDWGPRWGVAKSQAKPLSFEITSHKEECVGYGKVEHSPRASEDELKWEIHFSPSLTLAPQIASACSRVQPHIRSLGVKGATNPSAHVA